MKNIRAIIYLVLFIVGVILLIFFLNNFINPGLDQSKTTSVPATTAAPTSATDQQAASSTGTPVVSTVRLVNSSTSYYDVIGTVKSQNTVSLFPQTSGSIKKVNFQEGAYVNAGDIVVELTGNNFTEHPSETQFKIAQTNLNNAKNTLANVEKSNAESIKTANLQLQSAVNQANALTYDLAVIQQNQIGLQDGVQILQNSLSNTSEKSNRDISNTQSDLQDMINNLNIAQNDRAQTIQQINDLQNQSNTPADQQSQLTKLQATLDAQTKAINNLYDAIDKARTGLSTIENTSQLGINQILSQIQNAQNQSKVLDLNLNSTKTKLGYTGDSSDSLKLAQQAYNSTQVQLNTALENAQNQVKLAQLNYDLAQNSTAGLTIKAPLSGLISSLNLSVGQQVNPQTSIGEVLDTKAYQLEINIDPDIADRLNLSQSAEVELAGRTIEVPIKSVAPVVNGTTRLVKVLLTLPPITFKTNQTLNAKLPLSMSQIKTGESGNVSTTFLPLDAVIIGTESQFVYVNDNGKAKKVEVKLGQISGDQVEILSGLSSKDQVILQGAKDLSDGQTIAVK